MWKRVVCMVPIVFLVVAGATYARDTMAVLPGMPTSEVLRRFSHSMEEIRAANPSKIKLRPGGDPKNPGDYIVDVGELSSPYFMAADMKAEQEKQDSLAAEKAALESELAKLVNTNTDLDKELASLKDDIHAALERANLSEADLQVSQTHEKNMVWLISFLGFLAAACILGMAILRLRLHRSAVWSQALEKERKKEEARVGKIRQRYEADLLRWQQARYAPQPRLVKRG